MTTFGARFKAARRSAGLTQDELADRLGITKSSVSSYENDGATPAFDKLAAIRLHLETSLDELICGDDTRARMAQQYTAIAEGKSTYGQQESVSREEQRLLVRFRKLTTSQRKGLLDLLLRTGG
jgi:transcriptional regulator with XRE-family HTH domain